MPVVQDSSSEELEEVQVDHEMHDASSDGDGDDNENDAEDDNDVEDDNNAELSKKQLQRKLRQIDASDKRLSSFPGGPNNLSVLQSYGSHIAGLVWRSYID